LRKDCANPTTPSGGGAAPPGIWAALIEGMREETSSPSGDVRFKGPSPEATDDAIQAVLSQSHDRLERQFESIMAEASSNDPIALRQAWRAFESALLHHFDDEERQILPAFARQKPNEARTLGYEHQRIRGDLTKLGVDLDLHCLSAERVADFVASLRAHARREDDLLYPWAAHRLDESARNRAHDAIAKTEETPLPSAETWQIDLDRSSLRFSLRHIVVHEIRGQFGKWGGRVTLDGDDLPKSSVHVWVDLDSIDTGETERDDQLRSPEFFDVGRLPQAKFVSTEVRLPEHANPVVKGRLDLHGCTAEVDVEITRHNRWTDEKGTERVSYEAKARFDRRKFGLRWNQDLDVGGIVLGDEIEIFAQVEGIRVKATP
jgi:polyisoprenoid-binding protein YceI